VSVDTPGWVRDAAFYQIFPDRFAASERVPKPGAIEPWDSPPSTHGFKGGDLLGIAERLDYLDDLGINAIYMTPIFQSASNHRYHTYDYFKVDPLLGGDAALRELLDRAHERGMRVVLDGVFNHTGRGFWPFHHILEAGASSPYRDWFHLDPDVLSGHRLLTPYPPLDAPTGASLGYKAWWGLPALPKLNTDHADVREYLLSVAEHWLRFGIDGWRLDVPTEIKDPSFWSAFRRRCRAIRPDAYLVGEIWELAPEWVGEDGFDALMDYPLGEAILGFVGGPSLDMNVVRAHHEYRRHLRPLDGPAFARRLEELLGAYDPDVVAVQLNLIGSHDTPRALTVLGEDVAALRMATLLQCTLPGAPSIYYGDEIGLTGGNDPACRGSFPWDPSRGDTGLRSYVRALLALRASEPPLRHGSTTAIAVAGPALAFERRVDAARLVVAVNPGTAEAVLDARLEGETDGRLHVVELAGSVIGIGSERRGDPVEVVAGAARLIVPARTGLVWRLTH
jgi:neopullulanase